MRHAVYGTADSIFILYEPLVKFNYNRRVFPLYLPIRKRTWNFTLPIHFILLDHPVFLGNQYLVSIFTRNYAAILCKIFK
jgi:hypothetical protein